MTFLIACLTLGSPVALWQGDHPLGLKDEPSLVDGFDPKFRIEGANPGERVTVHAFRVMPKWISSTDGQWSQKGIILRSWAEFRADRAGKIDIDKSRPLSGSYHRVDPLGLLWSGYPEGSAAIPPRVASLKPNLTNPTSARLYVQVERNGQTAASGTVRLTEAPVDTVFQTVQEPGLSGVFAYPKGAKSLSTVISLHGSEGGSAAKARGRAAAFVSQGFAVLALNYFAFPHEAIPGVPASHINIPIEMLDKARQWISRQEAGSSRIGLYGVSKGAEFALVGATRFDWVKSVVAVVPTDVVWEGYGAPRLGPEKTSSWSFAGQPLPYIPLYDFYPERNEYRTNTERYERSRRNHPRDAARAVIPIDRITAPTLLIGSDRDEVWASGEMIRNMLRSTGGSRLKSLVFPKAGHQIGGTGSFPIRLYGVDSKDPRDKDLNAEGEAAVDAWKATIAFLRRTLR